MKKIIIICSSIVVFISVLLFLHFQTYSLYDIDADNYTEKLKESDNSIWSCRLDSYIPDNISLWIYGVNLQVVQHIDVKVDIKQISSERETVTITRTPSNLQYIIVFKNTEPGKNKVPVACQISNFSFQFDPQLVKIAEQLIIDRQFVLKKSKLINGHDILIKETDDDFIIVEMNSKCDYNNPPMSFNISTYSKKRFY